jgi:biopolymer transport protein ExbB
LKLFKSFIILSVFVSSFAQAATLDELLQKVKTEAVTQSVEFKQREAKFIQEKNKQAELLRKAKAELRALEAETTRLTTSFDTNEKKLATIEEELNIAMGTLGEMFGVVRQVAGDLKGQMQNSVVSAQIIGREKFAANLAESKALPNIPKLERLWYEMQREMTETGKTTQFKTTVVRRDGEKQEQMVTRVGAFNLVSGGEYYNYQSSTGQIVELGRQPSSRFTSMIDDVTGATGTTYEGFAIDPSRGSLLSMLVQAPSFWERLQQGGLVGYVIIALLFLGIGLVIERIKTLKTEGDKIKAQMTSTTANTDNALGQIMQAYESNKAADLETLELKMDEAILKSTPPLEKGIGTIKILAAVAPLLGLLGTVTGMIATFQSITLFGTGDPKLMAGGISQALMTTVLGLVCAIPLLLLHNLVANKSKALVQILEEESAGMIAARAETTKG